jgi:hypothetical protein
MLSAIVNVANGTECLIKIWFVVDNEVATKKVTIEVNVTKNESNNRT